MTSLCQKMCVHLQRNHAALSHFGSCFKKGSVFIFVFCVIKTFKETKQTEKKKPVAKIEIFSQYFDLCDPEDICLCGLTTAANIPAVRKTRFFILRFLRRSWWCWNFETSDIVKVCRLVSSCTATDDQIYVKLMCVLENFAVALLFTPLFLLDAFLLFLCVLLALRQLPSASQLQLLSVLAGQTIRRPAAGVACSQSFNTGWRRYAAGGGGGTGSSCCIYYGG